MKNSSSKPQKVPSVRLMRKSEYEEQVKKKQKMTTKAMENESTNMKAPLTVDLPTEDVDAAFLDAEDEVETAENSKPSGYAESGEPIYVESEGEGDYDKQYIPAESEGNEVDDLKQSCQGR